MHEISSIIEIKNGNLYFNVEDGIQKIELHKSADGKECLFVKNGTSDNRELRFFWDNINAQLNKQGFWLFDEG